MSARFKPLPRLKGEQALAADPQVHAALSASAGTGKTQVLTARVLRLLLQGAPPETILCLTFTKAAAAEMANRIGARLARWVRLKDTELATDLDHLGERNDPPTRELARRLFAKVLEAPGGLRIQTIHAFAQSLLAAFPAEAEIVPGFQPIEGRAEQELVRRTLADLLAGAEEGDRQLTADVQCLSRRLGEAGAVEYLQACAKRADALEAFGSRDTIEPTIRGIMELPDSSVDDYLAAHCAEDRFDCDLLRAIAGANRTWGAATGAGQVATIDRWLAMAPGERAAALPDLSLVVFTGAGELRKVYPGQIKADPGYQAHVERLAAAVSELLTVQRGAKLAAEMAAGIRAGQAFAAAYSRAKRSAGVADFDDLIAWTRRLLAKPGMGDWVRYKLDRQIDHILVDEAQDTNAGQWEIVERLAEEFFSGSSEAGERWRTLFMVGDFKQAIYGFQGTDPERFREVRAAFKRRADDLRLSQSEIDTSMQLARDFRDLSIAASFRSAQPILDAVDAVIAEVGFEAMGLTQPPDRHRAFHSARAGQVELWQPFAPEIAEDEGEEGEERWVQLSARLYADDLAARIQAMVDEAPVLASTGRGLTPGDVLVLVRSRGQLASLVVSRLFARSVAVAGVDRLHLHEPLAVQDLLAAIRFAVQPGDDLSLANLLVSPLLGWDQEQLFELAHGRKSSLWRELGDRAGEGEPFASARDALTDLLAIADFTPPSRFLETILTGPMQGRRKLYSRLGMASLDPIDELMNSALDFERNETASLDRFLSWFSRGDVDVQRDPAAPANEVRVMTVHGAKGLEAPVVILADSTGDPRKLGRTPLTLDFPVPKVGTAPLLRPKKQELCSPFDQLIAREEQRDRQEHMRLLYVAMTRAADRLIVAGLSPAPKKDGSDARPENCWHRIVERGLVSIGAEQIEDGESRTKRVYRRGNDGGGDDGEAKPRADKPGTQAAGVQLPGWALRPPPPEARPPRPLAPSALLEDRESAPPPTAAMRAAAQRGTLIHALLERLPALIPEKRRDAALRWLEVSAGIADPPMRAEIAGTVCDLLGDERFADLFGPGSLAEAPIAATLPDGRVIAGTVDRLLVTDKRVLVVDYKTGQAPRGDADIPLSHRAQMHAYVAALAVIFPGRAVDAALLYTRSATLFELAG